MRRRIQVPTLARRVPILDVYAVPEAGRSLNVGLLHATPEIDVHAMQEAAYVRFIADQKKR